MRSAYATFTRNWISTLRAYPFTFLIGGLLTGVLGVALAYFSYHLLAGGQVGAEFAGYAGTADYMSYVILGAGLYLFAVQMLLSVSRSLITERREGTLEGLLLAPATRIPYFTGVAIQSTARCGFELMIMLLVTWPLGLTFGRIQPVTLLLAAPVAVLGIFGMSVVLGALMLATGDTYISQNTLFFGMALLCGFTFPVQYLPVPLQWLGALLPVTSSLQLLRAGLLYGTSPFDVLGDLGTCLVLGLVYTAAGFLLLRFAERRALEGIR